MGPKILYVVLLILIFVLELFGFRYFLVYCHKGRAIDSAVAIGLIFVCMAIILLFTKLFDCIFSVF